MASLIHQITAITAALYGVNILEQAPPGGVRGSGTSVVAVVAATPWGPTEAATVIGSPGELFETFCPLVFNVQNDYVAMRAFLGKTFPSTILVVRPLAGSAAAAARTFDDASAGDSVTATARYVGAVGNQIGVTWTANADDATARDALVTIGTSYSVLYKQVATIVASALVVTDPGDPYVSFAKASGATLVPVAASVALLTAGSDGTAVAGDYTDAIDVLSDASLDWSVGFVAEAPSALLDAINAKIKAVNDTNLRGFWVSCTPAAQSKASALTYVSSYRSDRTLMPWRRVKVTNAYDPNRGTITVDGNAFAAVAIASVPPEVSPGGAPGAPHLKGIIGLEDGLTASAADLNALNAAGVTPFFMSTALEGAILHNAVTTSLVTGKTKVFRRRMTDWLLGSLAAFLERFAGQPLDLDLAKQRLGPITAPEIGELRTFLASLAPPDASRIKAWAIDEFGANTETNLRAGQWRILVGVTIYPAQEQIVLLASVGETVTVQET